MISVGDAPTETPLSGHLVSASVEYKRLVLYLVAATVAAAVYTGLSVWTDLSQTVLLIIIVIIGIGVPQVYLYQQQQATQRKHGK